MMSEGGASLWLLFCQPIWETYLGKDKHGRRKKNLKRFGYKGEKEYLCKPIIISLCIKG